MDTTTTSSNSYPLLFHPNPTNTRIHIAKFSSNLNLPSLKQPLSLTRRDLRSIPRIPTPTTTNTTTTPSTNTTTINNNTIHDPLIINKESINPSLVGPSASISQRLAPFQKRTKEIRLVDDHVRLARREEYTPWLFHVADPLASTDLSLPIQSKYEKACKHMTTTGQQTTVDPTKSKNDIINELDPFEPSKPLEPGSDERVLVGAREEPNSEYFLFVYDTNPVPDIAEHVHFNVVPVNQWFKFTERNLKTPTISGEMADQLLKAKHSKRPGAMAKLLDKIKVNEQDNAASSLKIKSSHLSNVTAGDLDELDFNVNEEFADDEEDIIGDLEDERDGAQRQLQEMVKLGLGHGEAMDDDFDDVEESGPKLKSEGLAVQNLLRKHQKTEYGMDNDDDDSSDDDHQQQQQANHPSSPSLIGVPETPKPVLSQPLKRTATESQQSPAPHRHGQDPQLQPWTGKEISDILTIHGSLSPGQLVQKLPNGMAKYKLYGKPGLLAALKEAGASRDKNGLLQLRQSSSK